MPELIWIYQTPGHEEAVVEGLRRIVGDRCPIVGGSSADNDVSGNWRQLGPCGPMANGLAVAVLFPSSPLGFAFQGGYEPAGPTGVVTGLGYRPGGDSGVVTATAGREIQSIDGLPAAEVYDRWTGHRIASKLETGGSILADTTMCPLAMDAGRVDGVTNYLLIHPDSISASRTLTTFRNVEVGARIYAMKGDRRRLVERAGRVARQAKAQLASASRRGHRGRSGRLLRRLPPRDRRGDQRGGRHRRGSVRWRAFYRAASRSANKASSSIATSMATS